MLKQISIYGKSKHLAHQAENQLSHAVHASGQQCVSYFGDVAFADFFKWQCPKQGEDVLFEHPTYLISAIFSVYQINLGPVVKEVLNCFSCRLLGFSRLKCSLLGSKALLLRFSCGCPRFFFCLEVFAQITNASLIEA